jgi:glycosyltransferase involved in cell wall biosynthesis
MALPTAVHQLIDYLAWSDATSNHTRLLRELLRSWGICSEIYVRDCDPRLGRECHPLEECQPESGAWLIYQYSLDSPLTDFALAHAEQTCLSYHNITPPGFFTTFDPAFAKRLQRAISDLERMRNLAGAVSVSHFNCGQLEALGFAPVYYVPLLFFLDELQASASGVRGRRLYERLRDGLQNIIFVGRVTPNKRFEHLIYAFHYYQRLIEPASRLLLVGASPHHVYQAYLDMLVSNLNLTGQVMFTGGVPFNAGFGAFYQAADAFLCLSEHEGFCAPIVESMYFDLPIIAYSAAAVPETLGDAGILVIEKRYDVIGELIYNLVNDQVLRQQVVQKQRERLADFQRGRVESQIKDWAESLSNVR